MATGVLVVVLVAWFFASVVSATQTPEGGTAPAGLLERLFSIIGCCWLSLLAVSLLSNKTQSKE